MGTSGQETTSRAWSGIVVVGDSRVGFAVGLGVARKACAAVRSKRVARSRSAVGGGRRWKRSLLIADLVVQGAQVLETCGR